MLHFHLLIIATYQSLAKVVSVGQFSKELQKGGREGGKEEDEG